MLRMIYEAHSIDFVPNLRPTITIDCAAIYNANSDAAVLRQMAAQTGYFPIFSGLAWVSSMIDLASIGLIGQKGMWWLPVLPRVLIIIHP
jgi:hypothetical protein